jgi:hypothetical protein
MHVAKLFLGEGVGGIARTRVEHGHVLIKLLQIFQRLGLGASARDYRTPCRQDTQLSISRSLRIRRDHGYTGPDQVRPILDGSGISFADDKDNRRGEGLRMIGQSTRPVCGDEPTLAESIYVRR